MTRRSRLGSGLGWVGQVVAWLVILGISAVICIAVLVPRIGGATPYVIMTGSMRPAMPPGTLVVARPVPVDEIGVGSVITYQLHSGDPTVVTHRVVAQGVGRHGHPVFQLQGDANAQPDPAWVRPVQVRGVRWYYVPYLGYVTTLVTGHERQLVTYLVVSVLLLYAGSMFVGAARDRRSRPRHIPTAMPKGMTS